MEEIKTYASLNLLEPGQYKLVPLDEVKDLAIEGSIVKAMYNLNGERLNYSLLVRVFRAALGLTKKELSVKTGISRVTLNAIESGVNNKPFKNTIRKLAICFGEDFVKIIRELDERGYKDR